MDALSITSSTPHAQSIPVPVSAGSVTNSDPPVATPQQTTLIPKPPSLDVGPIIASVPDGINGTTEIISLQAAKQAYGAVANAAAAYEQIFQTLTQVV